LDILNFDAWETLADITVSDRGAIYLSPEAQNYRVLVVLADVLAAEQVYSNREYPSPDIVAARWESRFDDTVYRRGQVRARSNYIYVENNKAVLVSDAITWMLGNLIDVTNNHALNEDYANASLLYGILKQFFLSLVDPRQAQIGLHPNVFAFKCLPGTWLRVRAFGQPQWELEFEDATPVPPPPPPGPPGGSGGGANQSIPPLPPGGTEDSTPPEDDPLYDPNDWPTPPPLPPLPGQGNRTYRVRSTLRLRIDGRLIGSPEIVFSNVITGPITFLGHRTTYSVIGSSTQADLSGPGCVSVVGNDVNAPSAANVALVRTAEGEQTWNGLSVQPGSGTTGEICIEDLQVWLHPENIPEE